MLKLLFLSLLLGSSSFAEEADLKISGMKCQSCVKNLTTAVCKNEAWTLCEVEVGHLRVATPQGVKIDVKKLEAAIGYNGSYKIEDIKVKN